MNLTAKRLSPNRKQFQSTFAPFVRCSEAHTEAKPKKVVVFGEMVAVLWSEGKTRAAVQLDAVVERIVARSQLSSSLCISDNRRSKKDLYAEICAEHSAVLTVSS
jgi:hypothetical protein